jgi:chromosomal replication initiator protein
MTRPEYAPELCPHCGGPAQPRLMVAHIQAVVANYYHIPVREMTSARRAREVSRPRQVAMYLSKSLTPKSLPDIGQRFGGRDHTTVMHAIKQIERLTASDVELAVDVATLRGRLAA